MMKGCKLLGTEELIKHEERGDRHLLEPVCRTPTQRLTSALSSGFCQRLRGPGTKRRLRYLVVVSETVVV